MSFNAKVIDYGNGQQTRLYKQPVLSGEELKYLKQLSKNYAREERRLEIERFKANGGIPSWFPVCDYIEGKIKISDLHTFEYEKIDNSEHYAYTASNRAKKQVYELVRANVWEYFFTVTFSPEAVDRYDYGACYSKLSKWLNNMRVRKAPDLKYMFLPEQHQDGAWHFHGIVSNIGSIKLQYSHTRTKDGLVIYNCLDWQNGFTNVTRVKSSEKVSYYITKYITKELQDHIKGRRRYLASQNLDRPIKTDLSLTDEEIQNYIFSLDEITYMKTIDMCFNAVQYIESKKAETIA